MISRFAIVFVLIAVFANASSAQEPPLPAGLSDETQSDPNEPALPAGLGDAQDSGDEPSLPAGLGGMTQPADEPDLPAGLDNDKGDATTTDEAESAHFFDDLNLAGFWEVRGGVRTQRDPHQQHASLGETRFQLEFERLFFEKLTLKITTDLVYDQVADRHGINLEEGAGWVDLRNLNVTFTPLDFMDVRIGRQILTWGTGDLLFLNDMFPKDWQSFFVGRDVEYLKAPSDALKLSFFSDIANWDIVYTPRFDPDRFITGERISYFNPLVGTRAGYNMEQHANVPNAWFRNDEWATRIWRNINGVELAAYGYWGYWKSPGGQDLLSLNPIFPDLNVYGASARGTLAGGIGNIEVAYYDSREDRQGNNRFINNSEMRFLVGYERQLPELANDLTVGGQYYVEWMMDYDEYQRTRIPVMMPARDELRHVLTFRLTKLYMNQNLELSLFAYYSPSDSDAYLRPKISYKIDDHWKAEFGGNVFIGAEEHTFFGQFSHNTNVYAGLRYSF